MAEQVLLRFSLEQPDRCEWLVLDHKGTPAAEIGRGSLADVAPLGRKRQLVLALPGDELLLTCARLPVRTSAGIARALPYALEEQLADDVEELHFARGPQDTEGRLPVAVISEQLLDDYLDALNAAGLVPHQILPAPLLLPWQEQVWALLLDGGRALLRYGPHQGLELEADALMPVLAQLLRGQPDEAKPRLRIWCMEQAPALVEELRAQGWETELMPALESALPLMATGLGKAAGLDLLQGAYGRQDAGLGSMRSWLPAAALLLLAVLVQVGAMGYDYGSLQAEEQALQAEVEALFHETFPEVTRLVDARAQAMQHLSELRRLHGSGSDPFLALLHQGGQALQQEQTLELTGVSFKGGVLQLSLKGKDLSQFEGLKQRLEKDPQQPVEVKILSANSRADGVDGRIEIRGRAS